MERLSCGITGLSLLELLDHLAIPAPSIGTDFPVFLIELYEDHMGVWVWYSLLGFGFTCEGAWEF